MASYQQDIDMVTMNNDMLNNSMRDGIDIHMYSKDINMDMGNAAEETYDTGEPMSNTLGDNDVKGNVENLNTPNIGAGPLPTGFGTQSTHNAGSTLTEFTKRRNWSQRVLEELKDMLYILTPDARLLYVSPSVRTLTGHEPADLNTKFMADFIHPDDSSLFIREFNESIATGNPLRFFYRFRTAEQKYMIFEAHGHPHLTPEASQLQLTGGPANTAGFCRGFFMMARPYPTKNAELLDSFLEHKIENARLQIRIAALKCEEAEEAESQKRHYNNSKKPNGNGNGHDSATTAFSDSADMTSTSISESNHHNENFNSMPPPAKPTASTLALTREALDEANAFSRPDSITDKMARYEGSSHVDSIEMLTGLRYREGERSHGISTGGTSPALIRGDAGIDIPADKSSAAIDPRYTSSSGMHAHYSSDSKKPKKVKSADEYVCTDCGTLDSPEWRKGPSGPKTLCNACGLRWAKKEKKRVGPSTESGNSGGSAGGGPAAAAAGGAPPLPPMPTTRPDFPQRGSNESG